MNPHLLADAMREAPERLDLARLPPRFLEARGTICAALERAGADAIPDSAIAAVLISEVVPMLTRVYGPRGASRILTLMADSLNLRARLDACLLDGGPGMRTQDWARLPDPFPAWRRDDG